MTKIKDPIYGYIELDDNVKDIIDSPSYQRLRDIIQTSYAPLYPTSVHNRFSHSLGVYFLGKKAIDSLIKNFQQDHPTNDLDKHKISQIREVFLLACLLHDIGHSPFSHTGEDFYLDEKYDSGTDEKGKDPKLIKDLGMLLDNEYRQDMIKQEFCKPKPHEFMSAYLGIKVFLDNKSPYEQNFFVRCIIGLQYFDCEKQEKQFLNACIELLNSTTIDVDKLDYLIRDSYMTGFCSIDIDYDRLLAGVSLNELEPGKKSNIINEIKNDAKETYRHVFVAFKKQSLSVLENVILANDLERKWIQSHPVILYNAFLIKVIIHNINNGVSTKSDEQRLFSYDALTETGINLNGNQIRFLSDADILYFAKNVYYDDWAKEYFDRKSWRHPLWKSQAEFQVLSAGISGDARDNLISTIAGIEVDLLSGQFGQNYISYELLEAYQNEKNKGNSIPKSSGNTSSDRTIVKAQNKLDRKIKFLDFLAKYCKEHSTDDEELEFNFVVITNNQFLSGLNKKDFKNIQIQFDKFDHSKNQELSKVLSVLSSEIFNEKYFYIYHKETSDKQRINPEDFCKNLSAFAVKYYS